jgi:Protein of unknown function (DUF1579)
MTTPIQLSFGFGRNGRAARLAFATFTASCLLIAPSFGQDEPVIPGASPGGSMEDKLPDDQPKGSAASTSASSTSTSSSVGSTSATSAGQPSEAEMMKMMMEMSKLNENHKLLTGLDGNWDYTIKMWMDGDTSKKPQESKGSATRKSIMDGRFATMDVKGKFMMPGADGKMKDMDFVGHGLEGYDNAKKKFVGSWVDNMGTGIMMSEGTYDSASKSFTYLTEYEMAPGMKQKIREVVKVPDNSHMSMEWYEDRGGKEAKTMQIDYTRKK